MDDSHLCVRCKGKGLCGRPRCPIVKRFESGQSVSVGESVFGASPPSVFVGRSGYPDVLAGPLVPPEVTGGEAAEYDDPVGWATRDVEDILGLRSKLVRSKFEVNVRGSSRFIEQSQEIALSDMPVDTEVRFEKAPRLDLRFDGVLTPMGPSGDVEQMTITENPSVPRKVDYLAGDTDVRAVDAAWELYQSDLSTYHINRLLSIGLLGREDDRRLVPTRWSITATDDMLGKRLAEEVQYHQQLGEIRVFSGGRLGNHFEVVLIPWSYAYELTEIWQPRSIWGGGDTWVGVDGEDHGGKKGYSPLAGGYYAARLPALEYLARIRRQAAVYMVREIRPSYWAPLGSWVVKEAARAAMQSSPRVFDTVEDAILDIQQRVNTPAGEWVHESTLLERVRKQRTLDSFLGATG